MIDVRQMNGLSLPLPYSIMPLGKVLEIPQPVQTREQFCTSCSLIVRDGPKCGKKLHMSSKEQMKAEVTKLYTCPMHPEVSLDKEGNCPKCGKALVDKNKNK